MKNNIFFVIYILFNPGLLKLIFRGIYIPVYIQYEWMKGLKIGTVIDVGAYRGKVSLVLSFLFPEAQIFAFEPSGEIQELSKKDKKNIKIENLAVGEKNRTSFLYETVFGPASSLLRLSLRYKESLKNHLKVSKRTKVKVTTLDEYFKGKKLKKPIFLKIDTQGMEGLVLKGSQSLLKDVAIIHLESPIKELYKGQAYFDELYEYLTKRNFKFIGDIPDSQFFPRFYLPDVINCVYVNIKLVNNLP